MNVPTHPGEILRDELDALDMSANALAIALRVPSSRMDRIVKCKRGVTPDTALRLAAYFGGDASVWINMQAHYDLAMVEKESGEHIRREVISRAA